jgi:predicted NUDIX family phosphoesterase
MEFVYVVPRRELFPECYPTGLMPFGDGASREHFEETVRSHGFFVERAHAEANPTLKQVIPYSVVTLDGRILLTRRLDKGGEDRLHGKLSIGIGGHLNPEDLEGRSDRDPVPGGTRREIGEELDVDGTWDLRPVGLLNDDSNPVGAVHVGLVQILAVHGAVQVREEDVLEGSFVSSAELKSMLAEGANFETWSSLLIERLDELLPQPLHAAS